MTYDFDPALADIAQRLPRVDFADVAAARAALRAVAARRPAYKPDRPVTVTDRQVPGPQDAPPVGVRIYRPESATAPLPGLVYLHGGGFMLGDLDTVHDMAVRIADQANVVVVSVDYRLAPEHPFPAALDDSHAALRWVWRHTDELGVDPRRIGVGGESAGGGLAAALALRARQDGEPPLRFQCLVCPELDDRLETVSARQFVDTPKLDRDNLVVSWRSYLGPVAGTAAVSAFAAPGRETDLTGLPPAFVSACEFDPLRDEDIAYAHRLIQAGVRTDLRYYPGTFHASYTIEEAPVSQRMIDDQVRAIREGLHG